MSLARLLTLFMAGIWLLAAAFEVAYLGGLPWIATAIVALSLLIGVVCDVPGDRRRRRLLFASSAYAEVMEEGLARVCCGVCGTTHELIPQGSEEWPIYWCDGEIKSLALGDQLLLRSGEIERV